ncbi:DUF5994 family protein [Kitasatospora sp. NBC_01266]|jgi:hypothetical protein|uniref:DUF5994 family protein n=1 Tax=Kitasatospora sp. NBC_01266 TaxID=2903572 RepID=UPI002E35E4A4|nr:DUF5994 family protein [Kitasatospora sp. NBC_01266]
MTVTLGRVTAPPPIDHPVRLSLAPDGVRAGRLDGAWWPRSRDLLLEIPSLAAELEKQWGEVLRITVNPAQWPVIPRRIPVAGHLVHVGWFSEEQDQHMIMVCSYTPRRLELLVVPPATDIVDAARLMARAADPASMRTASALIGADQVDGLADWEAGSEILPSTAEPTGGPDEAAARARVARTRAAAWSGPM